MTIPKKPGCYLMKDAQGDIIYVGKAKNLYNRVRSYFIGSHDAKTTKLVSLIDDFEFIITASETEAFILELNLIKKHQPKYNIMMTDDKTYPYICLTNETYPKLIYTRETHKKQGKYYGPYPNGKAAKDSVELLNRIYPLVKCPKIPKKECLYYHIGQCLAPCIHTIDPSVYDDMRKKINDILKGNAKEEINRLQLLMEEASNRLDFEKAIEYRSLIEDIKVISEKQNMASDREDTDAFGYYCDDIYISIQVFHMREGKLIERNGFLFEHMDDAEELFESFVVQFYLEQNNPFPKSILISRGNAELMSQALQHKVQVPKIGKKQELIRLVEENAQHRIEALIKEQDVAFKKTKGAQESLKQLLDLEKLDVIEAFDNSNISGLSSVSAMVVFVDGLPQKKRYRKFKIKTVVGANDVMSMYEVISRRYRSIENAPDLIIVDGGATQVQYAKKALSELKRDIPVLGLIKDELHKTRALYFNKNEIELKKNSYEFRFLEVIQEEVHRYAIAYFHQTHTKNTFASKLETITGIGKAKSNHILKLLGHEHFEDNLRKMKLSEDQIKEVLKQLRP